MVAGVTRPELAASCVTGKRSNQLNYTPVVTSVTWWAMQGLNLRLQPCKGCTLPTELIARKTEELISTLKMGVKQILVKPPFFLYKADFYLDYCAYALQLGFLHGIYNCMQQFM